jgi:chromate reductase, NAD(P)H dehydrogenase (quinone)
LVLSICAGRKEADVKKEAARGEQRDVAVFVGSLRKQAFSRKLANALATLAPEALKLSTVEIRELPLYNQDDEADPPAAWVSLRRRVKAADAVLFVTPEYNRSVPAALKNALDVASRPYGQSAWDGKPGAVVSVSPGALGGFGANHHLRQSLVFLNVPTLQQPEAYVGGAADLFDADGVIANPGIRELLGRFMEAFAAWVAVHAR